MIQKLCVLGSRKMLSFLFDSLFGR